MKPQIRITDPDIIDEVSIDKELNSGKQIIVQFSDTTYSDKKLSQLNELCKQHEQNFEIRFYGHHFNSFDFNTLLKLPDVKSLYVDCLTRADNIKAITQLQNLKKLSLEVYEMKETEILNSANLKKLTELIMGETKTKALNLEYLKEYKNLKIFSNVGHTKNIEATGELLNLEHLSLKSVKQVSVSFINKLEHLKTLKFILGGRLNIQEINDNEIENLEIAWVRGINDISNISNFKNLKTLLTEDNIQLQTIHFSEELPYLNDLKIINCKTLNSLTGLENLPSLHHLRVSRTALDFEKVINQKLSKSLKIFAFYTTKKKIDNEIKATLEKKGFTEY